MNKQSQKKRAGSPDDGKNQNATDTAHAAAKPGNTASTDGRTGDVEITQTFTARKFVEWYKEVIAIAKDTLDVAWKFIPVSLFFPAAMLWIYLHRIGWDRLFSDVVVTVPGFIVIIASSCVLLFGIFLQFCIPSILIGPAATFFENKQGYLKKITALHILPSVAWFTAITVLAIILELASWIVVVTSALLTMATAVACVIIYRRSFLPIRDKSKDLSTSPGFAVLLLSLCPSLAAVATSAPLLLCLSLVTAAKLPVWLSAAIFWICGWISMLGMAPGLAYLMAKVEGKPTYRVWRATGLMCMLIGYIVVSVTLYFAPVMTVILRVTGVADQRPYLYQVLKPDLVPAMRAVGIHIAPVTPSEYNGEQTTYFISAFSRFHFNNVELLCSRSFSLKDADASTWTNANVEESRRRGLAGGEFCVKVRSDEVRPIERGRL